MIPDPRLRPTVSIPEAGEPFGLGKSASYAAVKRGDFPVPVIKIGRRLVVASAQLLAVLGLDPDPVHDDAPPVAGEASVTSISGGTRCDQSTA